MIAPLSGDRAEFVYDPATQKLDFYLLNQGDNGLHSIQALSAQALIKVGTDTTVLDLTPDVTTAGSSHYSGIASFLRNVPLFQVQALIRPAGAALTSPALVADFEPWVDQRLTAPHATTKYVCPMHAAQGANAPGTCPQCGMALILNKPPRPVNRLSDAAYHMDFAMFAPYVVGQADGNARIQQAHPIQLAQAGSNAVDPARRESGRDDAGMPTTRRDTEPHGLAGSLMTAVTQPAPGQTVHMRFTPRRADGALVTDLATVHTKKLHLIIASRDLSFFDHVHPQLQSDGTLTLDYAFPRAGEFVLYADCTPGGDRNQVFRIPVTVTGTPPASRPLFVTPAHARTFGPYRVALTLTPDPPQTNDETQLTFTLSKDGLPLTDIQPFLGAGGHCVVLSEDTQNYLHSHPLEMGGDRFGPSITFHAQFPHPGIYKVWGQFQHQGKPLTADFVVRVP